MLWKILVLGLIIGAVLVGFRLVSQKRDAKIAAEPEVIPELDTEKCINCSDYVVPNDANCDRSGCPYR